MDPNATLRELEYLRSGDDYELEEYASGLDNWLSKGGFEPNWEEYPHGTSLFHAWQAAKTILPFNSED
jgi:hypothetical protein